MGQTTPLSLEQIRHLQREWRDPQITEEVVEQVRQYGRQELPREACGIVLPGGFVVQMTNCSDCPLDSYALNLAEISEFVNGWLEVAEVPAGVVEVGFLVWHTHPSGHVGPSQEDLASQRALKDRGIEVTQFVVALPDGPAVRF